ncbi:hypothetical protein [Dyadobacter sp. 676]|uniref:Uncharacterized protein n=1 Tax=Dyadobacter sp. 676 TaxID=3088362 RepID=A0AAU8FN56_9BACT
MKLILSKVIPSPLDMKLQLVHALDARGAFLLADRWKMLLLHPHGVLELLWQTTDEDVAYQWRGFFDDRLSDSLYEEIRQLPNGFQLLSKEDYLRIGASDLYKSARSLPNIYQGHENTVISFMGKVIALLTLEKEGVVELARIRTKGKDLIQEALHPVQNLIVYGTNHGELFAQPFDQDQFGKPAKIDQLPNTCYQIRFTGDGRKMFVAGLGYVKMFGCNGHGFTEKASVTTAVRSFELVDDYLVLNKGMHGIDIIKMADKPERIESMDLPFPIDKMLYLAPQRVFLLISGSTNEWALLNWAEG